MLSKRRRFTPTQSPEERFGDEARRLLKQARLLPPSALREHVLRRARHAETGSHMSAGSAHPVCGRRCKAPDLRFLLDVGFGANATLLF